MKQMNKFIPAILLTATLSMSCTGSNGAENVYEKYGVKGSFLLYDASQDKTHRVNAPRTKQGFLPASTFKLINALIALEEKVVQDENHILKWDGKKRKYPFWNRDHDLKSALKYSAIWYYQELARRIGEDKMRSYLKKLNYGNGDLSAGIDAFWLNGGFRVTQEQQIEFLRKLHHNKLPFSKRNQEILKKIMIIKKTPELTLRAKTGLTYQDGEAVGWWVGYLNKNGKLYFFANNIQTKNADKSFPAKRTQSARELLSKFGALKL